MSKRKMGLVFFPAFDWAISPTHPEREERLLYTKDQIFEEGLLDLPEIVEYKAGVATLKDIARVHFCVPDVKSQITDAHLIAVGGCLVLADALLKGEITKAFALVRPPGHHAMRVVHGNRGFCNINNEAIMIEYLRKKYGLRKIAVVDTDVHHGDGTQEIFYHDPDVLFISFHQDGRTLYPGSGFTHELGGPGAFARTLNVPLLPGTTDEGIHYVLDNLILPILKEWQPELVINSAGQDNHYTDPLANMRFSAQGYARLNEKISPDIAVLEGGYAIETALPYVNVGIILAMAGLDYSHVKEPDYYPGKFKESAECVQYTRNLVRQLREVWERQEELAAKHRAEEGKFRLRGEPGNVYQKYKHIYYDTDQIEEEQHETVHLCPVCPGYLTISSTANRGWSGRASAFAVSIPLYACPKCQEEGRRAYAKALDSKRNHDFIYLQDKPLDEYRRFDCARKQESSL